jgi:hypothetical protein
MKRNLLILTSLLLCLIYWACRKNETINLPKFQDPFVASAADYLKSQISSQDFQSLNFDAVQLLKTGSVSTGIIIHMKDKNDKRTIILGKQNSQPNLMVNKNALRSTAATLPGNSFKGNWLTIEYKGSRDSGIIHTKSFDGSKSSDVFFINRKVVKLVRTKNGVSKTIIIKYRKKNQLAGRTFAAREMDDGVETTEIDGEDYEWLPDVTITLETDNNEGDFGDSYADFNSLFWDYDEDPNYLTSYTSAPPDNDGGGGTYSNITLDVELSSGPIVNVTKLFKCFTYVSSTGATYTVKLCSDIPINSMPTSSANPFGSSPGHTFLTLTAQNGTTSVTRSFGFYPSTSSSGSVTSVIKDDFNHEYNASISMNITASQFNQLQQNATNLTNNQYNVCTYNCTNYALSLFNGLRTNPITVNPLIVAMGYPDNSWPPVAPAVEDIEVANSPQMLFVALQNMKNAGGPDAAKIQIDQSGDLRSPLSNGICN